MHFSLTPELNSMKNRNFTVEIQISKAFKMNKSIILEVLDSIHRKIKSCNFFRNSIRDEINNFLSSAVDKFQREKVAVLPSVANAVSWAFVPPRAWTRSFQFFFRNIWEGLPDDCFWKLTFRIADEIWNFSDPGQMAITKQWIALNIEFFPNLASKIVF